MKNYLSNTNSTSSFMNVNYTSTDLSSFRSVEIQQKIGSKTTVDITSRGVKVEHTRPSFCFIRGIK